MKKNSKKNHFKKQIVSKRKYAENDYKGEQFQFPTHVFKDNAYLNVLGMLCCLNKNIF